MDALTTAILAGGIAALWDTGRRYLASLPISRETGQRLEGLERWRMVRESDRRTEDDFRNSARERIRELEDAVSNHALGLGAHAAKHEALRTELERRIGSIEAAPPAAGADVVIEISKNLREVDEGVKNALARCDKNTAALENSTKSMQELLNSKFTAVALARGINQGKTG